MEVQQLTERINDNYRRQIHKMSLKSMQSTNNYIQDKTTLWERLIMNLDQQLFHMPKEKLEKQVNMTKQSKMKWKK